MILQTATCVYFICKTDDQQNLEETISTSSAILTPYKSASDQWTEQSSWLLLPKMDRYLDINDSTVEHIVETRCITG